MLQSPPNTRDRSRRRGRGGTRRHAAPGSGEEPIVDATSARVSGLLMLIAGAAILMGIITAEALFPASYTTSRNEISDLGSTWNPGGITREPSATIFNTSMLITGAMILVSSWFLYRASRRPSVSAAVAVLGAGVLIVGVFPGEMLHGRVVSHGAHPLAALLAFVSGGVAALLSARVARGPFRFIAVTLGSLALIGVLLSGTLADTKLGSGGVERWIAYPTVLWLVAFGGYLLAARSEERRGA